MSSVNEFKSDTDSSGQHSPCPTCKNEDNTQEHSHDIFGSVDAQLLVVEAFSIKIKNREKLRKSTNYILPGQSTEPDSK